MRPHPFRILVNDEVVYKISDNVANVELTSNAGAVTSFDGNDLHVRFNVVEPHDDLTQPPVALAAERVAAGLSDDMTQGASDVVKENVDKNKEADATNWRDKVEAEYKSPRTPTSEVETSQGEQVDTSVSVMSPSDTVKEADDLTKAKESDGSNAGTNEPNSMGEGTTTETT